MADEGGAAAARVEAQPAVARPSPAPRSARGLLGMVVIGGVALAAVVLTLRGRRPTRSGT